MNYDIFDFAPYYSWITAWNFIYVYYFGKICGPWLSKSFWEIVFLDFRYNTFYYIGMNFKFSKILRVLNEIKLLRRIKLSYWL